MDRIIFCSYWLYFYGLRGLLGEIRLFDYMGMTLVSLGLMNLIYTKRLQPQIIMWVSILCCPLFLAALLNPSIYIILYVIKMYVVALYFASYFKVMRLTMFEFACFTIPVVVSIYFFVNPRSLAEVYLLKGRMAGISEPNFTSLSLIYAMGGAFGVYLLTKVRRVKLLVVATALVCFSGVVLTASRAGFIGSAIALCLFLVSQKKMKYAIVAMVVAFTIIGWSSIESSLNRVTIFQRLQTYISSPDPLMAITSERVFTKMAWEDVRQGEWVLGGGPRRVGDWGKYFRVPHNSFLDVGLAFGKASFYFYAALFVALLFVNLKGLLENWRCREHGEKINMVAHILFLSLLPMYMTLSAGMSMGFTLWLVLGAYPLLHTVPTLAAEPAKKSHGDLFART